MRGLLPLFVKEKAMDHHLREIADCLDEVLRLLDSYAHVRSPEFSWCLMRRTVSLRARPFSVRAFASPGSEAKRRFADEPPPARDAAPWSSLSPETPWMFPTITYSSAG